MSEHNHRSTTRILDILEYIASLDNGHITLPMISKELDAPKSSLYPMLQTLVQRGYLTYDDRTYEYSIGSKCYEIGVKYINNGNLSQEIDNILQYITDTCQETCHLAELNGNEVFYINKKDSPQSIRMFSSPGKKLPAYATGLGKALLSEKSDEEIDELYSKGLYAITEHTITSLDELKRQLKEIRKTGFAYEIEESNQYIRCIAIPIKVQGKVKYAISVAVPVFRYTEEKERKIQDLLLESKKKLEERLVLPQ